MNTNLQRVFFSPLIYGQCACIQLYANDVLMPGNENQHYHLNNENKYTQIQTLFLSLSLSWFLMHMQIYLFNIYT